MSDVAFSLAALAEASCEKRKAVEANDFASAANWRDKERSQQQALHASGGPRPGCYRVRIDRPDGTHTTCEAPTLAKALDFHDVRDCSHQIDLIARCVNMLNEIFASMDQPAQLSPSVVSSSPQGTEQRTSQSVVPGVSQHPEQ